MPPTTVNGAPVARTGVSASAAAPTATHVSPAGAPTATGSVIAMPTARTATGVQPNTLTPAPAPLPTRVVPAVSKQATLLTPTPNPLPVRAVPAGTSAAMTQTPSAIPAAGPRRSSTSAITPATVTNDQPATLTIAGSNFTSGVQVLFGTQVLTEVHVSSSTALTATLPAGLCPGTYPVTVRDSQAQDLVDSSLVVQGVQKAVVGTAVTGPTFKINGRAHWEMVPQAPVRLTDTTCSHDDVTLAFSVRAYIAGARGQFPLSARTLRLTWPGAAEPALVSLNPDGEYATATVTIPFTGTPGVMTLAPMVEMGIPASAFAGKYVIVLNVTLAPHG
jgi:hypothetical protein